MADLEHAVLALLNKKTYQPLKPKALARKLNVPSNRYADFRRTLRSLLTEKRSQVQRSPAVSR